MAIGAGFAIAYGVNQFGAVSLLVLPAIGLFAISILYPELGLMGLILVTYTQLSEVLIRSYDLPSIAKPLAGLMLVVIVIRLAVFGDHAEGWGSAVLRLALYGFAMFLSVLAAKHFDPAMTRFQDYFKDALIALIIVFMVQNPARFKHAIWAIIIAGIFMASISSYQHLTDTYSNEYWGFGRWLSETAGEGTNIRVSGPFRNPNSFAQVLVVVAVLAIDRVWHDRKLVLRILAGWAVVASILAIFFTYSRGGFLALFFALAILLVERRPRILPLALTAAVIVILFQYVPEAYTERLGTLRELITFNDTQIYTQSYRGRLSENISAINMFRDNPILGVGPGNFASEYQQYSRPLGLDPRTSPRSPASLYGEILAETGILGMLAFIAILWTVHSGLRKAKFLFTSEGQIELANMSIALWGGLAGYLFVALNKNSAYSTVFWMLVGLAMAATNVAIYARKHELRSKDVPAGGR